MSKKSIEILLLIISIVVFSGLFLVGCSLEDEADVASYNISKEADNFNIYRKVVIINNQSDEVMLEFCGWCSINVDETENQLELTYRVGKDAYYKDFVGLNDRTTYVITQLDGSNIDPYYYEWLYHSNSSLIPIKTKDDDKKESSTNPEIDRPNETTSEENN